MLRERQMVLEHEKDLKKMPGFTDFPYTHGEAIVNLRGQIQAEMKADM